jgi:hypothetical protein
VTYDGFCEVGCIGMRFETLASVSGVLRRQIRGEVVESAFALC